MREDIKLKSSVGVIGAGIQGVCISLSSIKKGFNVAVCEQTETAEEAKINSKKGPLKREVVRIISPGTLTEDNLLQRKNKGN